MRGPGGVVEGEAGGAGYRAGFLSAAESSAGRSGSAARTVRSCRGGLGLGGGRSPVCAVPRRTGLWRPTGDGGLVVARLGDTVLRALCLVGNPLGGDAGRQQRQWILRS